MKRDTTLKASLRVKPASIGDNKDERSQAEGTPLLIHSANHDTCGPGPARSPAGPAASCRRRPRLHHPAVKFSQHGEHT